MTAHDTTLRPYFLQAAEGEAYWFLNTRLTLKATGESTGGTLTLIEAIIAPGFASPWHVHRRDDEMFYVLEGEVLYKCGDDLFQAGPGSFVFLPRNIPHGYRIVGETPAKWLLLAAPAGIEAFFIAAGTPALDAGITPQPLDRQKLAEAALQNGQEILGPPFS